MHTIAGRFNGQTIELLEDAPVASEAFVLVTFLEGSMELAAARGQRRSVSVAMYNLDAYRQSLAKTMAKPSPSIDRQRPFSVGEVMTRKVISVAPGANVMEAMHLMHQHGITSVLVEPGDYGEWGIMTMRDVLKRIVNANRAPEEVLVGTIATRPLIYVTAETSLRECSQLMIDKNIRRAVVREGDEPVGIISDTDLFQVVEERGWGPPEPVEDDHL
ncbi:MAG TPA: CBS domain-containing protein [Kouleothrix sp.]|uniref:CBS domain-containing protein n=1 Tax=Kouleothrix sp. TaxID=2779161 RepID=UPI002CF8AA58|nr:CBS domain-containing protein [Kouleothrix sp.]HRC74994.1 CBS domain-containing protein [Kouleothrix sp.]